MRRKVAPDSSAMAAGGEGGGTTEAEQAQLSTAIRNGEDLGPFVRRAFASGRPEALLSSLRHFARSKEVEIEDVCKAHYQDFMGAVDDLRSLLSDVDSLKSALTDSNAALQSAVGPLLAALDASLEASSVADNLTAAIRAARLCSRLFALLARANEHLVADRLYLALRAIAAAERDLLPAVPHPTIRRMLVSLIPAVHAHVERKISKEFSDWMVQIRVASRHLGQIAIDRASAACQRQAEEQGLRSGSTIATPTFRDHPYSLRLEEEEDDWSGDDSDDLAAAAADGEASILNLSPLYRAHHIHTTLGLEERFRRYYFENRKLQLTSDFQVSSLTPFLESHQIFFAQIAGFFIVEDRILRTGGGLIAQADVDALWEIAIIKMVSVLQYQFSRMQTANHFLLIKDYVSFLCVTLHRYCYSVDPLLDVLSKHGDKYHDLLLSDCRRQVSETLVADKFEQMLMKTESEYSMNVLSFEIQTSDITPAFPYVASFSSSVPDLCGICRSFIKGSISFMSHGGRLDIYSIVKKYLERLLGEVVDGSILRLIESGGLGVSQSMQVAANMVVLERACKFLFRHAAQLSGIPLRIAEKVRREFPLKKSRTATEELLLGLLRKKIDDFMMLTDSISWMADSPPLSGNEYSNEVIIYLETLVSTALQILPIQVLRQILQGVLTHISNRIMGLFLSDNVKRFNLNAVVGIDVDLKRFESFADDQSHLFTDSDDFVANELKLALLEARQLVNLLMCSNPEDFLNPVIRERSYNKLSDKKVIAVTEKFRESSDRLFGTFGTRGARQNPKQKSLDALIRRLKDAS
ncbi:hypothetical protein BHE74_00041483 [Ensete ventricosum]|nr:hypothetical protein BHE74_00041483 [Ensete ventricosum]